MYDKADILSLSLHPSFPVQFNILTHPWVMNNTNYVFSSHRAEDFDFTTSSEEVEMQEKTFKGWKMITQANTEVYCSM